MNSENFLLCVLDQVEEKESRLLIWGCVDAYLDRNEICDLIDTLLENVDVDDDDLDFFFSTDEVIQCLIDRALIIETEVNGTPKYRSRMAETVRLLFHLRQLFPKHAGPTNWHNAKTLVSDYRFLRRKRKYPKRDISISNALEEIKPILQNADLENIIESFFAKRGQSFQFADFQIKATKRILIGLEKNTASGTLVSAGTGSGKTLAFYIPALSKIASEIVKQGRGKNWVKCLALYPRTELLKDQFTEIYRESRLFDDKLGKYNKKIKIGAFFGNTPTNAKSLQKGSFKNWSKNKDGFICGFMSCPKDKCGGDLLWRYEDIENHKEQLSCCSCGNMINDDEISLTRESLIKNPPDILFTTTEMLNQRISDTKCKHLFGLKPNATKPPLMMLLDEVHAYSGYHGAQVAYLLRRWLHLVKAPISFVGLSATIKDGKNFFSRLTGIKPYLVEEIYPANKDFESEGAEYSVALKGDPVSKTALLSTTIQSIMLLTRMQDHHDQQPSLGIFGSRLFAFTDDLDVLNRLYFSVLDAEGRNNTGKVDRGRHPHGGLAHLRNTIISESRELHGQNWTFPEIIGHDLSHSKSVGRVSSQDPGVILDDIIVASASLEVGFNDPSVGVVVQHKAPRSMASFIQRKGRAGRARKMRPWTVVVLSDYGRDRIAYQSYDTIFDPELDIPELPLTSNHVLHIQAGYCLMDFLSRYGCEGSTWQALSAPREDKPYQSKRHQKIAETLYSILENDDVFENFKRHLGKALKASSEHVDAVLWDHPRPLMTTVIPNLIRKIETNWRKDGQEGQDFFAFNSPMPEFVPSTLFSELNLPEVQIKLPPDWDDAFERESVNLPINQAMNTFAPGRVSRRYGDTHSAVRHWVGPSEGDLFSQTNISIRKFYYVEFLGNWGIDSDIPVYRPHQIRPNKPEKKVKDTSNARLIWNSEIKEDISGVVLKCPKQVSTGNLIEEIEIFVHDKHNPVEVRRYAYESIANISLKNTPSEKFRFSFLDENGKCALGYSTHADALKFKINIPTTLIDDLSSGSKAKSNGIRTELYFSQFKLDSSISSVDNFFLRQWLSTIFFAGLTYEALHKSCTLEEACSNLLNGNSSVPLCDVLDALFQSNYVQNEDDEINDVYSSEELRNEIDILLATPSVIEGLAQASRVLWAEIDQNWSGKLNDIFQATVAASIYQAISNLCPDIDMNSLIVDCFRQEAECDETLSSSSYSFWISETSPGGSGHIEEFLRQYSLDPRQFYSLVSVALQTNEYELIDYQLHKLLQLNYGGHEDTSLNEMLENIRNANSHSSFDKSFKILRNGLLSQGFVFFHSFSTALMNRLLRPGSSEKTDLFLLEILDKWKSEEKRLGVELDSRIIAYLYSDNTEIDHVIANMGFTQPTQNIKSWRFNVLSGILWSRGRNIRRQGLEVYNPFAELCAPEPLIVKPYLGINSQTIDIQKDTWKEEAINALSECGYLTLECPLERKDDVSRVLNFFATTPIPSEYLSVYARLNALRREESTLYIDLELAEVSL